MRLDHNRSGPANRYWEFACALSREHSVTLLVRNEDHPEHPRFAVSAAKGDDLRDLVARHQVIVVQGPSIQEHPQLLESASGGDHYWVADLYDPFTLELLAINPDTESGDWLRVEGWAMMTEQLKGADFFVCASERQRTYWLGALAALGRLQPDTWDGGDFRRLVDVVPFGLPADPPQPGPPALRGVIPGIETGDRLLIWGGGTWDWLDPLTPVRAMPEVIERHPATRLVFFPSPHWESAMIGRARELAAELGLLDRHVLFSSWVSRQAWPQVLLEADIGLSFHPATLETHLAFRTRLLDYIWAGLPIVTAAGDVLGELVAEHDLGCVVPPGDVHGLAEAIISLLAEPDARQRRQERFRRVAAGLTWDETTQPLVRYCRAPWRAGDTPGRKVDRWRTADQEHVLSELAHTVAERDRFQGLAAHLGREQQSTVQYVRGLEQHIASIERHREELMGQVAELERRLAESERQFAAAMNGRLMRLLTGVQRTLRRGRT